MPYIVKGIKVGKLKVLLLKEGIRLTTLHNQMKNQCEELGIKPATYPELSIFSYGEKSDAHISKYLKVLNALNALRTVNEVPYVLEDLVDVDEILKPKKTK
jgi:hypothetical protein